MLTQSFLKEILHYDPNTGMFTRLVTRGSAKAGKVAGTSHCEGYVCIIIDGYSYLAHRLAHFYMTGEWPKDQIDHIDRNRSNNVWSNLREATPAQNEANKSIRSDNTSGYKGVYLSGRRFVAQIKVGGAAAYLGTFDTPEEAHSAYCAAAAKHFGEFARAV